MFLIFVYYGLSYREIDVLGRPLKVEEIRYVQEMAQLIAGILLLGGRLDEGYVAATLP